MPDRNMPVKHDYSQREVVTRTSSVNNAAMDNLRHLRESRGLSQVDLAEMAGVTQGTISKIEHGNMNVGLDKILAIAAALRVEPVEMFALPDMHRRALAAIRSIDPERRAAAIVVLEAMVPRQD